MVIDFAKVRAALSTPQVTRYVVTHIGKDGLRTLTFACQGRNTFATRQEAEEELEAFKPELRSKLLGDAADTLEVRECLCWPGHFDPVGIYFD